MQRIPLAVILLALLLSFSAGCTRETPQMGSLEVTSTPAGLEVQVILDGNYRGNTPLILPNLSAGSHLLQLRSTGYAEKVELVTVTPGQKLVFSASYPPIPTQTPVTPTPFPTGAMTTLPTTGPVTVPETPLPPGSLYVTSFPSGANIYLDGRGYGVTPRLIRNLTPRSYELKLSLVGWEDYRTPISVSPGLVERADVILRSS
ncbi:MAG: PEGA domain-containing protein [Methanomicrobiales archaeon]|nr:PEGA domain-containing protein [Methanomicrobiales archaeon]